MPRPGRRRGPAARPRRFGARDPLPEPDDPYDFSDDDEEDPEDADDAGVAAAVSDFNRRTGVELHARIAADDDEDPEQQESKGPVDGRLALRAIPVIGRTVLMYPDAVRGRIFRRLHLYGRFQMRGIPFLGCAIAKQQRVNLAVRRRTPPRSLESTLHHEIGHLVEMHESFPERRWLELNISPYTGRGHRDMEGKRTGPDMWDLGFITRYASKNRHEDFAELAEMGFTEPNKLREAAAHSEAIARKVELMTSVYSNAAPGLVLPWAR